MRPSCEDRLFKTGDGGYDFVSDTALVFYGCTLLVDIGEFKAGTYFDGILVDSEFSRIVLQNFNADGSFLSEDTFELSYAIGNRIEK